MASRLVCAACSRTATPQEARATCACGGLFEVEHPAPAVGPAELAARGGTSGVWRFREVVDPDLDPAILGPHKVCLDGLDQSKKEVVVFELPPQDPVFWKAYADFQT